MPDIPLRIAVRRFLNWYNCQFFADYIGNEIRFKIWDTGNLPEGIESFTKNFPMLTVKPPSEKYQGRGIYKGYRFRVPRY